jgi:RNA binding exosome subunit
MVGLVAVMVLPISRIQLRAFVKPEDDAAAMREALIRLSAWPESKVEEDAVTVDDCFVGDCRRKVRVVRVVLEKSRIRPFVEQLNEALGETERQKLVAQVESRLDEEGTFFLRLSKEGWLEGKMRLTESGDCFHVSIGVLSYPKKRELLVQNVAKIFNVNAAEQTHG